MMINNFTTIQANQQSIRQAIIGVQEWSEMTTTRWDDMEGQAGGSQRAQFVSTVKMTKDQSYGINFDLMIPDDWVISDDYVNIHDIHTRNADPSGQSVNFYIIGKRIRAVLKDQAGTAIKAEFWMDWIPGHIYQFRNWVHIDDDFSGYYKSTVNGQEWFNENVKCLWAGEGPDGVYWKVGPYIATPNWGAADFYRMFVRV